MSTTVTATVSGALLAVVLLAGCAGIAGEEPAVEAEVVGAGLASRVAPVREPTRPEAHTAKAFISVSGLAVSQQPIAERLARVRANVVTIVAGDSGGAGFFIDEGRHVLTTVGAVGRTPQVMVRLSDGAEVMGTVLLANGRRNVALIATEPVDVGGLSLMIGLPDVGAPVFAPGVSQPGKADTEPAVGVISAIHEVDGLRLIESTIASVPGIGGTPLMDAHGNVVGMAAPAPTAAPDADDAPPDVSFFMPVEDALNGLGVLVERPKLPEPAPPDIREANGDQSLDMETANRKTGGAIGGRAARFRGTAAQGKAAAARHLARPPR